MVGMSSENGSCGHCQGSVRLVVLGIGIRNGGLTLTRFKRFRLQVNYGPILSSSTSTVLSRSGLRDWHSEIKDKAK